ncbi:MAG TPA: acetylglucosamine-6-sulfatase, partial [Verrucomicrobiales bacterium]|nr:acetylglucosamine-6-sulfatase [Verrucomicrobiales bacterium]
MNLLSRLGALLTVTVAVPLGAADLALPRLPDAKPRNIIFILTDDQRYDTMGFVGHPWIETPNMDRLARDGAYLPNTFVTTSLCSPSRASILTGLYAHNHQVVDNYNPVAEELIFFPQYLQAAGYYTAFVGKWHMGDTDERQRGFDYWLSFKGQGTYWADGRGTTREVPQTSYEGFNFNGIRVPQRGYITDELTDYALSVLQNRPEDQPCFLYLSHKAVHSDFVPADRHRGRYEGKPFPKPPGYEFSREYYADKPMWLLNQRNSRHGADFGYNLPDFDLEAYYRRYCEALLAVDDSLGRILDWLEKAGELDSTMIVYMSDNGFQFGDHGLIDKRVAYESSIRVPLLVHCPEIIRGGSRIPQVVASIDIAPTLVEAAGLRPPSGIDGRSFYPLLTGREIPWRDYLLYEYFWEHNYPHTPTMHALRGDRYKYIRYHGLWDRDELYDLLADPRPGFASPEGLPTDRR